MQCYELFIRDIEITIPRIDNRMKTLLIFPGNIDNSFFINEIEFSKKRFDRVVAFVYKEKGKDYAKVAEEYGFDYFVIDEKKLSSILYVFKSLISRESDELRYEIGSAWKQKDSFVRKMGKIGYALFYYSFACQSYYKFKKNFDKTDDIYVYSFWMSRGAVAGSMIKNKTGKVKFFSRAHGYDLYENRNALNYLPFRKYIYDSADKIFFISKQGLGYYKKKYGFSDKKLDVSYLGVKSNEEYRKEIGAVDKVRIVSCSSINSIKRLDLIISLLSGLSINYEWIHVGDGELRDEIIKLAEKKLPKGSYTFVGALPNDKVVPLYEQMEADFFINLSDSEGIPVSIMEALSVGLPVIARPVGGIPEIVDGKSGLLVEIKDSITKEVVDKVESFLNNRIDNIATYTDYSNAAYEMWNTNFRKETNYNKFYDTVEEL